MDTAASGQSQNRPSLKELSDALKGVVNWEDLAIQLDFDETSILTILKHPLKGQKLLMMTELLQRDVTLTWEKLARALEKSKHEHLAKIVRARYAHVHNQESQQMVFSEDSDNYAGK